MSEFSLIDSAADFIEAKIQQVKKKFGVIYSSSKEVDKKESALRTLETIDRDLAKLRSGYFTPADLAKYEITEQDLKLYVDHLAKPRGEDTRILRNVYYERLNMFCDDEEVNWTWSYLNFFGREYLGLLSEQNLRLDYGHAFQRDTFFTLYHQTVRTLEDYGRILEQIESADTNNNKLFRDNLTKVKTKEYRNIIVKTGKFLHTIQLFVDDIVSSEKKGEKVLLDPEKIVEINGQHSSLEGLPARKAMMDMYQFVREFIAFLKIPDLEKIEEE